MVIVCGTIIPTRSAIKTLMLAGQRRAERDCTAIETTPKLIVRYNTTSASVHESKRGA